MAEIKFDHEFNLGDLVTLVRLDDEIQTGTITEMRATFKADIPVPEISYEITYQNCGHCGSTDTDYFFEEMLIESVEQAEEKP